MSEVLLTLAMLVPGFVLYFVGSWPSYSPSPTEVAGSWILYIGGILTMISVSLVFMFKRSSLPGKRFILPVLIVGISVGGAMAALLLGSGMEFLWSVFVSGEYFAR